MSRMSSNDHLIFGQFGASRRPSAADTQTEPVSSTLQERIAARRARQAEEQKQTALASKPNDERPRLNVFGVAHAPQKVAEGKSQGEAGGGESGATVIKPELFTSLGTRGRVGSEVRIEHRPEPTSDEDNPLARRPLGTPTADELAQRRSRRMKP